MVSTKKKSTKEMNVVSELQRKPEKKLIDELVEQTNSSARDHLLSNKAYDALKLLAIIIFPAIGTLYFTLGQIWGLPDPNEVVASIVAIDTFLGVIIKLGDASYNASESKFDGAVVVTPNGDGTGNVSMSLSTHPEDLIGKKEAVLKIKPDERQVQNG